MGFSFTLCPFRDIDLFVIALSSYTVVLDAGINPNTIAMDVWPDIIEIKIVGNVPVNSL